MTRHDDYQELVALYALGSLEAGERDSFEAHLASGCAACHVYLREVRGVTDELAQSIGPLTPPGRVRERLVARVRTDQDAKVVPSGNRGHSYRYWTALAAAASVIAAVGLWINARELTRELALETSHRVRLERELVGVREVFDALRSPQNRAVSLDGQPAAPSARASAFLDSRNGRLFLYVENLDPLPAGETYQIWLIIDGTPVSAGIFDVQADGTARLDGEPVPGFDGTVTVAITVEPAGGVPQPTGPMVLLGS